jgi:hypothetical protein
MSSTVLMKWAGGGGEGGRVIMLGAMRGGRRKTEVDVQDMGVKAVVAFKWT